MSDTLEVEEVAAERVQPLRTRILRDWEDPRLCVWEEDERPDTHHYALVDRSDEPRGVVTYVRRRCPEMEDEPGYQLRGMAIAEGDQRTGLGTRLVEASLPRLSLTEPDARVVWCNAREHAVAFYERLGFETFGEIFEVEGIGPHIRMWRKLPRIVA